jgi:hypothetical protein
MEHLGLEIQIISFLPGMGDRKELGNLLFAVIKRFFKVAQCFGFHAANQLDMGGLDFNIQPPDVEGKVPAGSPDQVGDEFAGMGGMG